MPALSHLLLEDGTEILLEDNTPPSTTATVIDVHLCQALAAILPTLPAWLAITTDPEAIHIGSWPNRDHLPQGPAALIRPPLLNCLLHARNTRRWTGQIILELILPTPTDTNPTYGPETLAGLTATAALRDELALTTLHAHTRIDSVDIKTFEPGGWTSLSAGEDGQDPTVTRNEGFRVEMAITLQSLGL